MDTAFARFALYDWVAIFLLACSFVLRGRMGGEQPTGCVLVGVFCGFLWPCVRELLLQGSPLMVFSAPRMQIAVFLGAFTGLALSFLKRADAFVPYVRILALAMATSFGLLCALPHTSVSGALFVSFFLCVLPCVVCDVALGSLASLVDESFYYTRAFLGSLATCAVILFLPPVFGPGVPADAVSLLCGVVLPLLFQKISPK